MRVNDYDYAYAVARIRVNELGLLTSSDIEQLASADSYEAALRFLEEKGWISSESDDVGAALKKQMVNAWKLLREVAPDISVLDFLIVRHDFHNIKAALKEFVSAAAFGFENSGGDNFLTPSIADPEQVRDAVRNKDFDTLPDFAKDAAAQTYDVLIRSADGQLADIMLDASALNATIGKAEMTRSAFVRETAELICATANIKIAFRAARTGRDRQFLNTALCDTATLDKDALASAAESVEQLAGFISKTPYGDAAELIKTSGAAFERWCDDRLMSHVYKARYIFLGVEPLIAFYIAKEAEIKNVRIILSCKRNELPYEAIRERVRKVYV